jgi:hypothetical protein
LLDHFFYLLLTSTLFSVGFTVTSTSFIIQLTSIPIIVKGASIFNLHTKVFDALAENYESDEVPSTI